MANKVLCFLLNCIQLLTFALCTPIDGAVFTPEEIRLFEMRVEEGYDLTPEGRYLEWLSRYHPELLETNSGTLI